VVTVLVVLGLAPAMADAEGRVPYSYFEGLSAEHLSTLQVFMTPIQDRRLALPSLAMAPRGVEPNPAILGPFQREGLVYAQTGVTRCSLSPAELTALIDTVATLPEVIDGGEDSVAVYSFALVDTAGGATNGFESTLNRSGALELASAGLRALRGNSKASETFSSIECGLRLGSDDPPGEVTGALGITLLGLRFDPATRRVSGSIRVVNLSRDPIPAPIVIVVATDPPTVTVAGADGNTCRVFYPGCPYLVLPVDPALTPGASLDVPVVFENPRQRSFQISTRAFTGFADR